MRFSEEVEFAAEVAIVLVGVCLATVLIKNHVLNRIHTPIDT